MKIIIGIGNPDPEYVGTRHNVGHLFLGYVARKIEADNFELNKKLNAMTTKGKLTKMPIVLAKPLVYVNQSGNVAAKLKNFYKVKPEDIIVLHDDLDIEFGRFKVSFGKNSGGHRGVESIIKSLKTKNFYRLRLGIATRRLDQARQQTDKKRDEFVVKHVLSKFTPSESNILKKVFKEAYQRLSDLM